MTSDPRPRVLALIAAAPAIDAARRAALLPLAQVAARDRGGIVVSTCHRVELLIDEERAGDEDVAAMSEAGMMLATRRDAAAHVIALALGLDSAVVGEDQVLHQLRTAVAEARHRGPLGADLEALLDRALRAGRLGRSWRPAGSMGEVSLADVALGRIEAALGPAAGRRILIVGAGEMGRAAVTAAARRGARVAVASPSMEHARAVAGTLGASAWSMDPGAEVLEIDGVIVALSGPWTMSEATAHGVGSRALVVDLSMPPALPTTVRDRLGDRLVDIDGLAVSGTLDAPRARYRERLERLADRTLAGYLAALAARQRSGADRLARRIERQRALELEAYLRRRPELDAAAREMLDEATRDLSVRLFRDALARLASDPDGRRRRALDELFGA